MANGPYRVDRFYILALEYISPMGLTFSCAFAKKPFTSRRLSNCCDKPFRRSVVGHRGCGRSYRGIGGLLGLKPGKQRLRWIEEYHGGAKQPVLIECRPLDQIWMEAGNPRVSVIKIDVEGGESDAIAGAHRLIHRDRPALVIEWSRLNLPAYEIEPTRLFRICRDIGYRAYASAHRYLCEVHSEAILRVAMAQTETFLLVPEEGCCCTEPARESEFATLKVVQDHARVWLRPVCPRTSHQLSIPKVWAWRNRRLVVPARQLWHPSLGVASSRCSSKSDFAVF